MLGNFEKNHQKASRQLTVPDRMRVSDFTAMGCGREVSLILASGLV